MRGVSDRNLPEPFRSWADRTAPLPTDVRLLPRTVRVGEDVTSFLFVGVMFGGMGLLILLIFPPWNFHVTGDSWIPAAFFAVIISGLWILPVILLRRLCITLRANRDLKDGTLRQGVFLGPEGLLVRMEPNLCYAISTDRFIGAKLFPPERSRDDRKRTLIIETLDGKVECFADRLGAHPDEIHDAARELWPAWRKPEPLMRAGRRKRKDVQSPRKMRRVAFFFAGSMLLIFASLAGIVAFGDSPTAQTFSIGLLLGLILLAVSAVCLFYWVLRFKLSYRCPECRGKAPRVDEALPAVHYYCPECNIEWDTGIVEVHDSD